MRYLTLGETLSDASNMLSHARPKCCLSIPSFVASSSSSPSFRIHAAWRIQCRIHYRNHHHWQHDHHWYLPPLFIVFKWQSDKNISTIYAYDCLHMLSNDTPSDEKRVLWRKQSLPSWHPVDDLVVVVVVIILLIFSFCWNCIHTKSQ